MLQRDLQHALHTRTLTLTDRIASLARPLDPERLVRRPLNGGWSVGHVGAALQFPDRIALDVDGSTGWRDALRNLALDLAPAQMSLAWLMAQPGVTAPIASATNIDQLREILQSANIALDATAIATLDRASA